MSLPSPKIDQRSHQDLVQQTQALVTKDPDAWQSPPSNQPDAGLALIRIFGHLSSIVSDRLNLVPDRNLLAFINLIGTQLTPPQPARVPVTFNLAEGSPADVLIPAHTQVSAPPLEGEKEEVIFETEQELLVTGTQLKAMFVVEDRDYYSDRSDWIQPEIASSNDAFLAFKAEHPVEHSLYLNCEEIFDLPDISTVSITIDVEDAGSDHETSSAVRLRGLLHRWFYWSDPSWQPLSVESETTAAQVVVTLTQLPKLLPVEINSIKAKWLRVDLNPHRQEHLPEISQIQVSASIDQTHPAKACSFNATALDLSKDFYPFGTAPLPNDTFSIALDQKLIKPGVAVEIQATLSRLPEHTADLTLIWEIGDGQQWQAISAASAAPDPEKFYWQQDSSPPKILVSSLAATLQFPVSLPVTVAAQTEYPYQVRARLADGLYGTRGRERKYVLYNDTTLASRAIATGSREIFVDSIDALEMDDVIRIQSSVGQPRQEEIKVINNVIAEKKLILEQATRNAYEAGSRILSKFITTESTPDRLDPPLLQSVALTYRFTLQQSACYYAYNDFTYCEGRVLEARLNQPAKLGDRIVYLNDVSQMVIGEMLRFDNKQPEIRQIELIDPERQLVILTAPLSHDHRQFSPVVRAFHPLTPALNSCSSLYLGFSQPFANRPHTLYLQVESPDPLEVEPTLYRGETNVNSRRITWEYASPTGWQSLVVQDQTQTLAEAGLLQFIGPTDFIPSAYCGHRLYWLRARKTANDWDNIPFGLIYLFRWAVTFRQMNLFRLMRWLGWRIARSADFPVPARLRSVRTNTTWASQSITLENELLGSSNGELNQVFSTSQFPILFDLRIMVREERLPSEDEQRLILQQSGAAAMLPVEDEAGRLEAVWIRWQEVADFYSSGANDRHYVIDRQAGRIQFGNGQAGMIPPRGRNNICLTDYQIGGGTRGNRAAETISELKTTIPYIDSVINWEAAKGGNNQESLECLKERAPKFLRHRNRAVTAQDFEDLTYEASTEVARVRIITPEMMVPSFNPLLEALWVDPEAAAQDRITPSEQMRALNQTIRAGHVQVVIAPHSLDRQPTPSLALLNRIETFLKARFVPTLKLSVTGPKWQEIRVTAEIVPVSVASAGAVKLAVEQQIHRFLHPLSGSNQGQGWSFGRKPHHSDLYAVLEAVPGVSYVRALDIQPAKAIVDQQTLIYSGRHTITLKLPD